MSELTNDSVLAPHLAKVLTKLNRFREATEAYTKAIELEPKYALAYEMRGDAYMNLGEKDLANKDYQQAARLYQYLFKKEDYSKLLKKINELTSLSRILSNTSLSVE